MNPANAPASAVGAPAAAGGCDHVKCYLVGGGIAGLASAVYLIRDGHVPGRNIQVLEASRLGGSLDAGGSAEQGYSMRGTRMLGPAYVLTYELLDGIVVFTVEYSMHSARLAVSSLVGLSGEIPPTYEGLDHPNALVEALRRILA